MKKFIKIFLVVLVLSYVFMFLGGWMLFDFNNRLYLATAACAAIISVVVWLFAAQSDKIAALEKRVAELESKSDTENNL